MILLNDFIIISTFLSLVILTSLIAVFILFGHKKEAKVSISMLLIIILGVFAGYLSDINSSPEELYTKVSEINKTYAQYYKEVNSYYKQENYKVEILKWSKDTLAISYLQKVIKEELKYNEAYIELANIYIRRKKYSKALTALDKLEESLKNNFRKLELEGIAYYQLGNKEMAADRYKRILQEGKSSDNLYFMFLYDDEIKKYLSK